MEIFPSVAVNVKLSTDFTAAVAKLISPVVAVKLNAVPAYKVAPELPMLSELKFPVNPAAAPKLILLILVELEVVKERAFPA